jgi:hypothetical protein
MKRREASMRNGNKVKSVSLADGTLSPDQRVNYEFGLVLGVNEFRQEQLYFLEKDYLYNRAFQGYGTVSGLDVTAKWLMGEEVEIDVSPGLAIDQFGRPIVVREAQCARLTAWLKMQQADTIAAHRDDDDRDLHVYIVARYDKYPDGQVPIAGQACNSGDTSPIYSRIHDSYIIDFSWDAPTMPAWDSVRCFAKMLAQVHIRGDAERNDTEEIIEQMLKLDTPEQIPLCAPSGEHDDDKDGNDKHEERDEEDEEARHPRWYIPADEARESLDRIFMTWVTEVRPKLLPNLLDPTQTGTDAQPDILLARIDFTLDDNWPDNDPKIEEDGFDPPDNGGRPFLLPTQLVQELLLLGHGASQKPKGGNGDVLPEREFATIQIRNDHTLYAWVHHPRQLEIESDDGNWGEVLEVRSNGQPLTIAQVQELEPNFFEIRVKTEEEEGSLMLPGARVELIFKVDEITVERTDEDGDDDDDDEAPEDLGEKIEGELKEAGGVVKKVVRETGDVAEEVEGGLEEAAGEVIEGVGKGVKAVGKALEKATGLGKGIEKAGTKIEQAGEKVESAGEELVASAQEDEEQIEQAEEKEEEEEEELSLGRSIRKLGLDYVGYDRDDRIIIVYTMASHIPVRELVTFFTYDKQSDVVNVPYTELKKVASEECFLALWFHTDEPVRLPPQVRVVRTFLNQQPQELIFRAMPPGNQTFSWFWALDLLKGDKEEKLVPGELLTVIFNTNEIGVGGEDGAESLTEVMKGEPFTCVGYDGDHTIELHHQVSIVGSQREEGEESNSTGKLPDNPRPAETDNPLGPTLPFVTVTVTRLNEGAEGTIEAHLELWFHLSSNPDEHRHVFTDDLNFDVLLEDGRRMRTTQITATSPTLVQQNVYTSVVTLPAPSEDQRGYYLRLRFRLDANPVNVRGVKTYYQTLGDYIRSTGIRFEGYNGEDTISAYVRTAAPRSNTMQTSEAAR